MPPQQDAPTVDGGEESTEGWSMPGWRSMPEWLKDALVAGPAGALTLYGTWSPLLKVADHWREGALEKAFPLTLFVFFLAGVMIWLVFAGFRRLRQNRGW